MPTDSPRAIARRIGARFVRRGHRHYPASKAHMDPAYAAVARELEGDGRPLLDIGCGLGLLGLYLRESGWRGEYLGTDFDADKVAAARAAAEGLPAMRFVEGDARVLPASSGHVVLLDVLHYLPQDDQAALLREAAVRVAPGAMLLVRNVLRAPNWRFRATVVEEWLLHATRWMRSPARHFPTRAEIEAPLREAGFEVDASPLWGNTPFNSFLLLALRPAAP